MEAPKPKPPVKKTQASQKQPEKKPFKLKAHLSYRPFSNEALFAKLREQAQPEIQPAGKSNNRKEGRK